MGPITTSILLGITAALANGLGGAVIVQKDWERRYLRYFVALGAGFMLGTAFLEMLPESIELAGSKAPLLLLVGYFIVHFFEHTITGHFHFGEETHSEQFSGPHKSYSVLFGLVIHTFFDGIAIASGFLISGWLGWVIFLAVILHKVPEGFTASSVMLAGGSSRRAAWLASAVLGLATVGGVLTITVFTRSIASALPLSAGVTLYVAASDLIPEVNKEPGVRIALVVFIGVGLLALLQHYFH
ncbi:MAG TPA: ZIP family metal transporter [Candidatus Angelobacter sp.]|nr:ZIP family metal transporter [Candidatus Angelobacter sp.]